MLTYNTQLKKLLLPEYGRNIQKMVEHCMTIEDREERNRCARTIIASMGNLFPALRDSEDSRHKLWDHLAIMSDFQLDIDYPVEVIKPDSLTSKPEKLEYGANRIALRHYGHLLEDMIAKAASMDEGEEREALVMLLANHMKKTMLAVNKDGVDDAKVFKDIERYSHGAIRLNPETHRLHEFKEAPQPSNGKKKKKK